MKTQLMQPFFVFVLLACCGSLLGAEILLYPVEDMDITFDYNASTTTVGSDGQWWPHVQWVSSPPLETQFVCEFDLSSLGGIPIAYAELNFYVRRTVAMDAVRMEAWSYNSDGLVQADDYDAGDANIGTWSWDSPAPGTEEILVEQHIQFEITSQVQKYKGDFLAVNIRLAGDRDDYDGNVFNDTSAAHRVGIAAVENTPAFRPFLRIIPMPPQDTTCWQMKQKDIHNTGRAAVAVAADRMNDTFFDTIIWQKRSGGGTGAFYGTGMIYYDGVGPDGEDLTLCANTWPNHVTCVDRHTGKLIWQDTTTGGDTIGRSTQAFSNDGATVYSGQDVQKDGHKCLAFSSTQGPGTNGANVWGNGGDIDPNDLKCMSPTIAPDGRIFMHQWNEKVYAGVDNGTAIQVVWESSQSLSICQGDTALYEDEGTLKVVQTGRGGRISVFDGTIGTGTELWYVNTYAGTDASPTVDPTNGNIYVPGGFNRELYIIGLDIDGNDLWDERKILLNDSEGDPNNLEEARSTGCLSHDGRTFYFQSAGPRENGKLYAVNTADGSLKWSLETNSWRQYDNPCSSPIVTENGVIVVGNNYSGQYLAVKDDTTQGTLLDTFDVEPAWNGPATLALASASLSPDGLLYLPLRTLWTASSADGETPDGTAGYFLTAFDLVGCDGQIVGDSDGNCKINLADFAAFAENWMFCNIVPALRCDD